MADDLLYLARLPEADREQFRIAINTLFTEGFLVRAIEQHERPYRFVLSNLAVCESYLGLAGWTLRTDESLGVIAFVGPAAARLRLRKLESIIALIARLLYEEKAGEIELHGERTVRRHEIQDRYRALTKATLKKTPFLAILRRLQSLRLIRLVGDDNDPDATVILYPSLAFALDAQSVEELEARLEELARPGEAGATEGGQPSEDAEDFEGPGDSEDPSDADEEE
ncbi:MAG: DUF4194 domain-containing protein [Spirochaetota bacterium]